MTRYLPLIAAAVVVVLGGAWRIRHHRRRYGSSPVVALERSRWRDLVPELTIGVLALLLAGEILAWSAWPQALISRALVPPLVRVGLLVNGLGLLIVLRAQSDLGASWRIGIDRSARPGLMTQGLYRFSRNPIYIGGFVLVGGFTFLMPTALSMFILGGLVFAGRAQVLREERYLDEAYGSEFQQYAARVGRFLPGIGRLTRP